MALEINEKNFEEEVLKSTIPVLVDFWAPWCGPCQSMSATIEEIAEEKKGSVKVCKVNVDENPGLCQQFGIMSIPNFIFFKNGQMTDQVIGALPKEELLAHL